MELRVSIYTDVPSRQPLSKPAIQIGDNHAPTSPTTTLNDSHAHNSHCRWPARPILVCDRLRHGAAADAPTVGISSSQPLEHGYLVPATVVDMDGVPQLAIRGDGSTVHTGESSFEKAFTVVTSLRRTVR